MVFNKRDSRPTAIAAGSYSVLDAQCVVQGNISSNGTLRIDGRLEGDVLHAAVVVVGEAAVITGNVTSGEVVVGGTVQGNINAESRVELEMSAKVTGDIRAQAILVHEGATLNGRMLVGAAAASATATSTIAEGRDRDARLTLAAGDR